VATSFLTHAVEGVSIKDILPRCYCKLFFCRECIKKDDFSNTERASAASILARAD
jgi:hypothetical protein